MPFQGTSLAFPRSTGATLSTPIRLANVFQRLNDWAKSIVLAIQEYFTLAWNALRFAFSRPFYGSDLVQQMDAIGVQSLGIVLLTGFFTGMVLALQSSVQLKTFGATIYMGRLVSASMIRELGPVLAGLMVAGCARLLEDRDQARARGGGIA
jgi:ABC-type transporter Mla maintaining outer membrane lipid asymmetry permease subunit MlaE